jgi:PKD repeat protein
VAGVMGSLRRRLRERLEACDRRVRRTAIAVAGGRSVALEGLEGRALMSSAWLSGGILNISGDANTRNTIATMWSSDGRQLTTSLNGKSQTWDSSQFWGLRVTAGSAGDSIRMDPRMYRSTTLTGGNGNDTLVGGAANDLIYGNGGNDWIDGGSGNDTIDAGAGNDTLYGSSGDDSLNGNDGTDYIDGGGGTNKLVSSAGTDTVLNAGTSSTPASTSSAPSVTRLELWNADSDKKIQDLVAGQTIDLAKLPTRNLTVVAQTSSSTQSVRFAYNGNANYMNDNSVPYAMFGESSSDLRGWTPSVGSQAFTATAYSGDNASGTASSPFSLNVQITDSGAAPSSTSTGAYIVTDNSDLVAGQTFFVNGANSKLAVGNPVTAKYEWDFGDANSGYNQLIGFNAAHTYYTPGTYTVKLKVTDEAGNVTTATTSLTVRADNRRTIYVAANGSDSNDGLSPDHPVQTANRAGQLVKDDSRILFRRGDTFMMYNGIYVGGHDIEMSSYGTGNVPVLKRGNASMWEAISVGNSAVDITIDNIGFDTDTPANLDKSGATRGVTARGTRLTVRNCKFYNVSDAINANEQPHGMLVQDNEAPNATSVRGYFIWMQGQDIVVLGNKVANCTREHDIRIGGADRVLMEFNDFTNLDRRSQGDNNDIAKGCFTIQKGSYIYCARNKSTGGGIGVGPLGGPDGKDDPNARASYVVVESNLVTGIGLCVSPGAEHVMIRNNIIKRDSDEAIWLRPTDSYIVNGSNVYAARNIYDLTIANNTSISSGTNGNFLLVQARGAAGQVTLANNLMVAPNMLTGQSRTAAVYINDDQGQAFKMFRQISGNVWDNVKMTSFAQGGTFYAYSYWSTPAGYLDAREWDAMAADGDRFGSVGISSTNYAPATWSVAVSGKGSKGVAGVFADVNGNSRAGIGQNVSAGAVQL